MPVIPPTVPHRNRPYYDHPIIGTTQTYRPDLDTVEPDADDLKFGRLVVSPGMAVSPLAVFLNWNGQPELDMIYVHVGITGARTHVTPFDLGLTSLESGAKPFPTLVIERPEGDYYVGPLEAGKRIMLNEYGEDDLTLALTESMTYMATEHRGGTADSPNQWGRGPTETEAWRYLLGADFGPVDSEYDDSHLRALVATTLLDMDRE